MFNILLVEDSSSLIQIMDVSLKQAGFNIQEVKTASDAIYAAKGSCFDVVLCDADMAGACMAGDNMPRNDVFCLIRMLCQLTGKEHSSLIAFSNQTATKKNALEAGADCWITKPFDADELVNDVLSVIH